MKKLFFATALLAVTLVGCNQDQDPNPNTDDSDNKTQQLTPAQQYILPMSVCDNAFNEAGFGVGLVDIRALDDPELAPAVRAVSATAEPNISWKLIEKTDLYYTAEVVVDYGTANVLARDGRQHRGKMIVTAQVPLVSEEGAILEGRNAYETQGTVMNARFEDWYVDNIKVEADTFVVTNTGRDDAGQWQYQVESAITLLTSATDTLVYYEELSDRTWIEGNGNVDINTHTYSILGVQIGETPEGVEYTTMIAEEQPLVVNVGTRYPRSGMLIVSVPTSMFTEIFPEYGALLAAITDDDGITFYLTFVGNNKAKVQFEYVDPVTKEPTVFESEPYDLTNI